jgi:hypothetical protein
MRITDATKKKSDGRSTKIKQKEIYMAEVLPNKYKSIIVTYDML